MVPSFCAIIQELVNLKRPQELFSARHQPLCIYVPTLCVNGVVCLKFKAPIQQWTEQHLNGVS